jgi:hypothetical protein
MVALITGAYSPTLKRFLLQFLVAGMLTNLAVCALVWQDGINLGRSRTFLEIVAGTSAARMVSFLIIMALAAGVAALFRRLNARQN